MPRCLVRNNVAGVLGWLPGPPVPFRGARTLPLVPLRFEHAGAFLAGPCSSRRSSDFACFLWSGLDTGVVHLKSQFPLPCRTHHVMGGLAVIFLLAETEPVEAGTLVCRGHCGVPTPEDTRHDLGAR